MRILVVEDEPLIALNAVDALEAAGHHVIGPYNNASSALEAAAREKPDFALLDINLAGHNEGLDLARDLDQKFGVRSLFASGQRETAFANQGTALGFLCKPYSDTALQDAIPVIVERLAGGTPPPPTLPEGLELF